MEERDRQDSGPFGRGGNRALAMRMEFFGRLGPAFVQFTTARAARLDLTGWIADEGNRVVVQVQGPEAMVGAFEMACCIGPDQADVQAWDCHETPGDASLSGFRMRRAPDIC